MRRVVKIAVISVAALFAIAMLAALPNPKDANISIAIARTLRISGLPQLAIPFYTYTMERAPKHGIVPRSRGLAYHAMGKHDAAIADYDLSEKLEPQVAYTNYLRAQTYAKLGRHEEVLKDLDTAVMKAPKDAKIRYYRAYYLLDNKKPWQAISDLNAVVAMHDPKSAGYYLVRRAHVYEDLGIASRMWADHFASCKGPARQKCMLKSILHVKKRQKEREDRKREIAKFEQMTAEDRKRSAEFRHLYATLTMEPQELQFRIHRSNSLIESKQYWPAISELSTIVAMRHPKWTRS